MKKKKIKGYAHRVYYNLKIMIETDNYTQELQESQNEADNFALEIIEDINWDSVSDDIVLMDYDVEDIESEPLKY